MSGSEADKHQRDILRYRDLLLYLRDPPVRKIIEGLLAESEKRLAELKARRPK
jgi:hypothetical protein